MPPKSRGGKSNSQRPSKPSITKSSESSTSVKPDERANPQTPFELQQKLLNIFRNAFPSRFEPDLPAWLQEVKRFLYHRDFVRAFERDEYREAYAVRWSSSRALGYVDILRPVIEEILKTKRPHRVEDLEEKLQRLSFSNGERLRIACLGGGAGAEMVAVAGLLNQRGVSRSVNDAIPEKVTSEESVGENGLAFEVDFVDIANWAPILDKLYQTITTPPPLSAYASASAKANSIALTSPSSYSFTFSQHDVLKLHPRELNPLVGKRDLVTLLFTLNELYTTSSLLTQTFLLNLTACMAVGSLLLVVDSAGDYSEVGLGEDDKDESRRYPMHWLLDRTLLKSAAEVGFSHPVDGPGDDESAGPKKERKAAEGRDKGVVKWKKVREEDSRWFRLPDGVKYPLDLENMRYQLHLYRRMAGETIE